MPGRLDQADRGYLQRAVELSRGYRDDQRRWPFGAIVVVGGQIAGQGVNRVVELHDPAAHAEIMALRAAGMALGRHVFEDAVLYSSSEPCPMCLAACYCGRSPRRCSRTGPGAARPPGHRQPQGNRVPVTWRWRAVASQAPSAIRISPATTPMVSCSPSSPTPRNRATTGIT